MKVSEIAKRNGLNETDFLDFVIRSNQFKTTGTFSTSIDDADVERAVMSYQENKIAKEEAHDPEMIQKKMQMSKEKQQAISSMLISSGFSFEGYRIVKYSGYISGDDAVQIPRSGVFGGNNGQNLTDALVKIRIQAMKELKEAAYELVCNAVVGVDFDYITLEPQTASITGGTLYEPYIICVTANGNAVVIEKDE